MSLDTAIANRAGLLTTVGKNVLNIRYPNEFELYLIALELTDEVGKTLRYFVFPVMPSTLDENESQLTNIKKTQAGVSVLSTPTFVPNDINLSGNFGRNFKVLLGDTFQDVVTSFNALNGSTQAGVANGITQFFDERVKTGYGCCKVLEDIINQSNQIGQDGQLRKLIFHNPALGNSYLVKAMNLRFSQSEQTNMIWNYSLVLKNIAPLGSLFSKKATQNSRETLSITGFVQSRVNNMLNVITSIISN